MRERPVSEEEYASRIDAARRVAEDQGWAALVVVGRGGGALDRYAQLYYLTDAYSSFPTIPDLEPAWIDRGFAAAVVGPDRVVVCGDDEPLAAGGCVADDVLIGTNLVALLTEALVDLGLDRSCIGLAGGDVLSLSQGQRLLAALPHSEWRAADAALAALRVLKSDAEVALLRRAGRLGAAAMRAATKEVRSGASEATLAAAASFEVASAGGWVANAFAYTFGPGAADPRRRLPPFDVTRPLRSGDLTTLDVTAAVEGYFFDLARSWVVDAKPAPAQATALRLASDTVNAVVAALRPGGTVAEAAAAGRAVLQSARYDMDGDEFQAFGHGLGLGFEAPWIREDDHTELQPGMCFAVERFCVVGDTGATYERNVVLTDGGAEDLAPADDNPFENRASAGAP